MVRRAAADAGRPLLTARPPACLPTRVPYLPEDANMAFRFVLEASQIPPPVAPLLSASAAMAASQ